MEHGGQNFSMSKAFIKQLTQEQELIKDTLKSEYNKQYEGTDPVKDAIHTETQSKMKTYLTFKDIQSKKIENYPFQNYGLGITSYFRLMKILMYTMLAISVLIVPILIIYGS